MGSRDGDSSAEVGRSRSSGRYDDPPFVNHFGGYTWDEGGEWTYDGCNGIYPPSRHDPIPPHSLPFNGRKPFPINYGTHYLTFDENEHIYPSDKYGRYRSSSPEALATYRNCRLPIDEPESDRRPGPMSPNPERLEPKPRYNSWEPAEEERLVSLISEGKFTWAQISMQFESRGEDCCRDHWLKIQSKYPDVHYVNPGPSRPHLDGDTSSSRRPRRG